MKLPTLLLVGSLLANVALVAGLALLPAPRRSDEPRPADAARGRTDATAASAAVAAATTDAMGVAAPRPGPGLWARLQTSDLGELNRRLRAAGFPPAAVRALLAMAIDEERTARSEALFGKPQDTPYWRNQSYFTADPAERARLNEIYRDAREKLYRYVEGPDALAEDETLLNLARRSFGKLPLEKLQQLTALEHDLENSRSQVLSDAAGRTDAATLRTRRESLRAADQAHLAAVGQLLSPAEFEEYDLRNNSGVLREHLAAFRPTEEEYRALYQLYRQMSDPAAPAPGGAAAAPNGASREFFIAQATAALGPERYADLEVLQTNGSDQLPRLMARLDLPLATIRTINAVRDDLGARAKAIAADPQLTAADRDAQLAALAGEASEKLTATLGARGYAAYADLKGEWIRALAPRRK